MNRSTTEFIHLTISVCVELCLTVGLAQRSTTLVPLHSPVSKHNPLGNTVRLVDIEHALSSNTAQGHSPWLLRT
ncbi:hypothetical protein F4802DRAFT_566409 [Xylaria palmicola]|nr:hypothetical protein F4802DRAFT_566409 [Xylaria palmicola]